jgi:hypothetical protein
VTRVGNIELRVPQGRFRTEIIERYQRSEKALAGALTEMYVQCVSTRKVKTITEELSGPSFAISFRIDSTRFGIAQTCATNSFRMLPYAAGFLYSQRNPRYGDSAADRSRLTSRSMRNRRPPAPAAGFLIERSAKTVPTAESVKIVLWIR